jgi:hypothetical protein
VLIYYSEWRILIACVHAAGQDSLAVTLLTRIREVPCSNLGRNTDYSDWGFSWISAVPPEKQLHSTLN